MNRPLNAILDDLGGDAAVAAYLRVGQPAISNWKARGVPKGRWVDLIGMAGTLGKELTIEEVRAASALIAAPAETQAA